MTRDEQMTEIVNALSSRFGTDYVITLQELYRIFFDKYGTKQGSIIPSDYCYNRVNNGITLKKPALFEFLGDGNYRCLGLYYPYNGSIYHKPKGQEEFIVGKCINGERIIASDSNSKNLDSNNGTEITETGIKENYKHKTNRAPSMKLRFEILKRDNFKCCACGSSPATNPTVELHIDHIIPWSKGGETVKDNLQTLCSICNIGKGDSL